MNLRKHSPPVIAGFVAMATFAAQAQITYFKADNLDTLDLPSSWSNNNGLAPSSLDTAVWDATVSTPANCTNTAPASFQWGGIIISNPAAPVKVSGSSSAVTLTVDALGITNISQDLWLNVGLLTSAAQTWSVASGHFLTGGFPTSTGQPVIVQNDLTLAGYFKSNAKEFRVNGGATLTIGPGSTLEVIPLATSKQKLSLGVSGGGTIHQTGGTVLVNQNDSGSSSNPKSALSIGNAGAGIYDISGGSLIDNSPANSGRFDLGNGAGGGTLNISGTASVQAQSRIQMAVNGGDSTINVNGGSLTLVGELRVGTAGTATSTVNVNGGTIAVGGNVNLPSAGTGIWNSLAGNAYVNAINVPNGASPNTGTLTINDGLLMVTNSVAFANTGTGTVNLNGGTMIVNSITRPSTATATLNFNGGTLMPRGNQANFIASTITANVLAGGAIFDTKNFNVTLPVPLLNGGGADGGLTKLGSGILTLAAANTYNGSTKVNGGALYLTTTNHGGGAIIVSNNATLHTTVAAVSSTLNCSSLSLGTLGASAGGMVTNEFDLNGFANPAIPVINAGSLAAAGTVYVTVLGSGWAPGPYHLIQYTGSVGGSDYALVLNLVSGAVGYVTNNTGTHCIDLVITGVPSVVWRAQVNTNWDAVTANWVDLDTGLQAVYPNGASVLFDDSASNALVYATAAWAPASATITNIGKPYTFTGVGRITGSAGLIKQGDGSVTMGMTNNDYSGDTVISAGTFKIAANNAIPDGTGKGNVTLEGRLDLNGFSEAVNGLSGSNGIIDNSGGGAAVFTVGNGGGSGTFAGQITNSTGSLGLTISGGAFALLARNGYAGGTTSRGSLQLGYEQSIGTGPLALQGSLLWTDTAAHVLTNRLTLTGGTTFGAATNGSLTVPGTVDLGGYQGITCNTDVRFQNGFTNGGLTSKAGPGTFTVKNNAGPDWLGSFQLAEGTLVLDHAAAELHTNNFRIQCRTATNGLSRFVVTNGATFTTSGSGTSDFKVGATDTTGVEGATNQLDLYGAITVTSYPGTKNNRIVMGGPSALDVVNLNPGGVLTVRGFAIASAHVSATRFNFNGGTLRPFTNDMAATFMQGLDGCYLEDGGAFVDTAGFDITIAQDLQPGGGGTGGLTKQGLGTLDLNGNNTYTGPTVVQAGALGGSGTISGPVTVLSGAALAPGASLGTLRIFNTLTLLAGSRTVMEISKDSGSPLSDLVEGVTSLTYGGTLVVTNIGTDPLYPLAQGDVFTLFSASPPYHGSFANYVLPALPPGLGWDRSQLSVNGTIQVIAGPPTPPTIGSFQLQNGDQLVISGSGGTASGPYYVLSSTNVALPIASWTPVSTNLFEANGNFSFTNAVSGSVPREFFRIEVP